MPPSTYTLRLMGVSQVASSRQGLHHLQQIQHSTTLVSSHTCLALHKTNVRCIPHSLPTLIQHQLRRRLQPAHSNAAPAEKPPATCSLLCSTS